MTDCYWLRRHPVKGGDLDGVQRAEIRWSLRIPWPRLLPKRAAVSEKRELRIRKRDSSWLCTRLPNESLLVHLFQQPLSRYISTKLVSFFHFLYLYYTC